MKYTFTVEYKNGDDAPMVHRNMTVFGGRVTAVAFYDALAENERMVDTLEKISCGTENDAPRIARQLLKSLV